MPYGPRLADRLSAGIERFRPVLASARARDLDVADTSAIVTSLLAELFGYDEVREVTREPVGTGGFRGLATRVDGTFRMIVEVRPIGLPLEELHDLPEVAGTLGLLEQHAQRRVVGGVHREQAHGQRARLGVAVALNQVVHPPPHRGQAAR